MRKDSLNDIPGFSLDLAKLHRDSTDSLTDKDEEYDHDDLSCYNLPSQVSLKSYTTEPISLSMIGKYAVVYQ